MASRIPEPVYDYKVGRLVRAYKAAIAAILAELDRIDVANMSRAMSAAALVVVTKILASLNDESAAWVAENIPQAVRDGVLTALVSLDEEVADKVAKFSRINRGLVAAAVADTQADLLAVTKNVERRVRTAVRQVTAESMRANMSKGINGRRTISTDILAGLRKKLGDSVNTGIIDAAGRRWKPEVYVEMVTRTKMAESHREATFNEAIGRRAYYGRISRHGAADACRNWEGRIVKLVRDAPGDYPYIGDLPRREIFHPNCRHVVSPIRDPHLLSNAAENTLPSYENARISEDKLAGYALNPAHIVGKNKAVVFEKVLGYNVNNWMDLRDDILRNLPNYESVEKGRNNFGSKFEVVMPLTGPSGRTADVTTGWQIDEGTDFPRLVTIMIKEAGKSK
ncbi:minor capsid protein 2 [Fontibacillus phaseoli]|uniref:Minor capsid protein 2 n=1 Tax=Fontibacillus phaseoli TaxID=1416533 RepID=A0A369BMW7_9BACL|nr:minor capsid protein 2 [Fontibacillus phaseoli]